MAGRIRSIKPELLEDEKTASLSDREWRLFVSLIILADDYGNFRANGALLNATVFWARPDDLAHADRTEENLASLEAMDLLSFYEVRGQRYAHIRGWEKHQRVDKPGKPRVPQPNDPAAWSSRNQSLYFVQQGEDGPIKIGKTRDVVMRLARLQTSTPHPLHLLASVDCAGDTEGDLHKRFADSRMSGEWFRPTPPLLSFIEGLKTPPRDGGASLRDAVPGDSRESLARPLAPDHAPRSEVGDRGLGPDPGARAREASEAPPPEAPAGMESRQSSEPKTSRAKPRTRCPASDAAEVAAFVERWGLPRGHPQQARFLDFHCGKGNLMADWAAAWRTWLRNTTRFEGRGSLVQQVPSTGHEWLAPEEWAT